MSQLLQQGGKDSFFASEKVNSAQLVIMQFVDAWVKKEKTMVPKKKIMQAMAQRGVGTYTVLNTLNALVKKGYLRRSDRPRGCYIQLRSI